LPDFFRVFAITRTITPGGDIGLGPALSSRILHLYGGTIAVENLNPPGVRFQITLPKSTAAHR
jgi:signal transduction histidine kinase